MKKIAILSRSCAYFAAPFLARALDADLYVIDEKKNAFFGDVWPVKMYHNGARIPADHLIVIGASALMLAAASIRDKQYKSVAVIFSDTNCCIYSTWWNVFVKKHGVHVYVMPDLAQYCKGDYTPIYQVMDIPESVKIERCKNNIVVCHSPGPKGKWKGSAQIRAAVAQVGGVEYVECTDMAWIDAVKIKARAHIFVDQLVLNNPHIDQKRFGGKIEYQGAIGKSGLEAMLLGCCTISGCKELVTEPFFESPPVVYADYHSFTDVLRGVIADVEYRTSISEKQKAWASRFTSPDFVSKHVTRHI